MFLYVGSFFCYMFKKLRFGTAGSPLSSASRSFIDGIPEVRKINLDAMELEFVRQIFIKENDTEKVKQIAEKNDVKLTCHGQYYINLNSKDKEKQEASVKRVYNASKIAALCGAKSVTFHAGYFQDVGKEEAHR